MEPEEDMFVVIVGDNSQWESGKSDFEQPIVKTEIKEEVIEDADVEITVENLLETASKHGEYFELNAGKDSYQDIGFDDRITIKVEESDTVQLELDFTDNNGDPGDKDDPDYEMDTNDDDPENECDSNGEDYLDYEGNQMDSESGSKRQKTSFQKSFVEDLRNEYPALRENTSKLIETLAEIMKSVKRPPPPKDYFIMTDKYFECVRCEALSETEPAAWRHYQEKHGTRYLVCYACGADFRSPTNLYKHEKRCSAKDATVVLKARAIFLGRKGRSRPFLSLAQKYCKPIQGSTYVKKTYPCELCSAVFNSKNNLISHTNLHIGQRPYQCHVCPSAYTSPAALSRHVETHTGKQYICDHCSRPFKVKGALIAHLDTHLPYRKFGCKLCDRRYAQKAALKLHIDRVHLKLPPPHPCQICHRRFPRMSVLNTHMKKAHGMSLMTRKMFFKALPKLTDTQLEKAKLVLASAVKPELKEEPYLYEDLMDVKKNNSDPKTLTDKDTDLTKFPLSYVLSWNKNVEEVPTPNKSQNSLSTIKSEVDAL